MDAIGMVSVGAVMTPARALCWAVAMATGCSWCGGPGGGIAPGGSDLRVTLGDIRPRLFLTGTLEAVESTRLSVPVNPQGKVQIQWMADDGASVRRGDPLAELDSSASAAVVDDLRLDVLRDIRELDRVRAQSSAAGVRAESAADRARVELAKAELDASVPRSVISEFELEQRQLRILDPGSLRVRQGVERPRRPAEGVGRRHRGRGNRARAGSEEVA